MKVVGLSALTTGLFYPQGNITSLFKFMYWYLHYVLLLGIYSKLIQETSKLRYYISVLKQFDFLPTRNEHITVDAT